MASKARLPDFMDIIEKHRQQGFGWRYDGVEDWSTEAIIKYLRDLGVDTDADRFAQQAAEVRRFEELEEKWVRQITPAKGRPRFVIDFPMMAVPVLWERLAAHVVCADLIEDRLYKIITAEEKGKELPEIGGVPADVAGALELARFIRSAGPGQGAERYEQILEKGEYDYHDWLLDLIDQQGMKFPEAVREIADGMLEVKRAGQLQSALAVVLERRGERDEAIARARMCIEKFGDDDLALAEAGDVFELVGEKEEAVRIWLELLPKAKDAFRWETIADRLGYAFEKSGRRGELEEILKAHPSPPMPPAPIAEKAWPVSWDEIAELEDNVATQLTSARTVNRNDPCPCGSGKKYKKCCMP